MEPGGSKFIINRDVTFDETRMGMKCKDLEIKQAQKRGYRKFSLRWSLPLMKAKGRIKLQYLMKVKAKK